MCKKNIKSIINNFFEWSSTFMGLSIIYLVMYIFYNKPQGVDFHQKWFFIGAAIFGAFLVLSNNKQRRRFVSSLQKILKKAGDEIIKKLLVLLLATAFFSCVTPQSVFNKASVYNAVKDSVIKSGACITDTIREFETTSIVDTVIRVESSIIRIPSFPKLDTVIGGAKISIDGDSINIQIADSIREKTVYKERKIIVVDESRVGVYKNLLTKSRIKVSKVKQERFVAFLCGLGLGILLAVFLLIVRIKKIK